MQGGAKDTCWLIYDMSNYFYSAPCDAELKNDNHILEIFAVLGGYASLDW